MRSQEKENCCPAPLFSWWVWVNLGVFQNVQYSLKNVWMCSKFPWFLDVFGCVPKFALPFETSSPISEELLANRSALILTPSAPWFPGPAPPSAIGSAVFARHGLFSDDASFDPFEFESTKSTETPKTVIVFSVRVYFAHCATSFFFAAFVLQPISITFSELCCYYSTTATINVALCTQRHLSASR